MCDVERVQEVTAGGELSGKVFLRPYRGERIMRDFKIQIPASLPITMRE